MNSDKDNYDDNAINNKREEEEQELEVNDEKMKK